MFPPRIPTVVTGVLSSMLLDSVTFPYQAHLPYAGDLESPELFDVSRVGCKKSLVPSDNQHEF